MPHNPLEANSVPGRKYGVLEKCKVDGNLALRQNDLGKAYSCYTRGIAGAGAEAEEEKQIINDIYRNRSHTNLLLGCFDQAISDALSSLTFQTDDKSKALDAKAYFRAGCAAYQLEDWNKARDFFTKQKELTPDDRDAKLYLGRISSRLREQDVAGYKFTNMKASLSRHRPRVDAATYLGKTEVKKTCGRGRGLFATNDINQGEIVICEKAFCIVWSHEDEALTIMTLDVRDDRVRAFPAGLAQALVCKLRNNPSQLGKVQALYSDHKGVGEDLIMGENGPIIDTLQIYDIICRNAFSPGPQFGEEDAKKGSAGLWIRASYMNHSCIPNTEREFIGDLMVVRATKDIKAGDEITHIYDDSRDVDVRAEALMRTWGFECSCARCIAERQDGPLLRKQRHDLEDKANAFVQRESPVNASRLLIRKAEGMAKAIEGTYDEKRYEGLPRPALWHIEKWLAVARPTSKKQNTRPSQ